VVRFKREIVVLILHMTYKYYKDYKVNQSTLRILALFKHNPENQLYLREIAREIQIDPKAVKLQLDRLEKQNILTSKQRGKNKEYNLNRHNYLTSQYLIVAEASKTTEYLATNFEIKKLLSEKAHDLGKTALLFGSFAKGNMTKDSDIDILAINEKRIETKDFFEMGNLLNREINIKCISEEQFIDGLINNDPLIAEVVANHIVLKGTDNICSILWDYYTR
jgi:DNA-binding MarR family transcriptional regulator